MPALLIARFDGDVDELTNAYDRAHALIISRGGATSAGELRHHCAVGDGALFIIGVWESAEHIRSRWSSDEFEEVLVSVGFPAPKSGDITILDLHAVEPPEGRQKSIRSMHTVACPALICSRAGAGPPRDAASCTYS